MDRIQLGQEYNMFEVGKDTNVFMDNLVDCIKEYKDSLYSIENEERNFKAFSNRNPKTDEDLIKEYEKLTKESFIQTQNFEDYVAGEKDKDLNYNSVIIHFPERLSEYEKIANEKISFLRTKKEQYLSIEFNLANPSALGINMTPHDPNGNVLEGKELDKVRAKLRYAINQIDKYINEIKEDMELRRKIFNELNKSKEEKKVDNVDSNNEIITSDSEDTVESEFNNSVEPEDEEAKKEAQKKAEEQRYVDYLSTLTEEELEEELKKLKDAYKEAMELKKDPEEIEKIKNKINMVNNEISKRKIEKPNLEDLTDEELEQKLQEKKQKLYDEKEFRSRAQNGMEENDDTEIDKLQEEIAALEKEKLRRSKTIAKDLSEEPEKKEPEKDVPEQEEEPEKKTEEPEEKKDYAEDYIGDETIETLPVKVGYVNRRKLSKVGRVVLVAIAAVVAVGLPFAAFFAGSALATGFGLSAASAGLSAAFGGVAGVAGFGAGTRLLNAAVDLSKKMKTNAEIKELEQMELERYVHGIVSDIESELNKEIKRKEELILLKRKCEQRIILLQAEIEQIKNERSVDAQKQFEIRSMEAALTKLKSKLNVIEKLLTTFGATKEEKIDEIETTKEETEEKETEKTDEEPEEVKEDIPEYEELEEEKISIPSSKEDDKDNVEENPVFEVGPDRLKELKEAEQDGYTFGDDVYTYENGEEYIEDEVKGHHM